jgi:hypothetical protein
MPGTVSVSANTSPSIYKKAYLGSERVDVTLACVSDSSAGTVPDQALGSSQGLSGLVNYNLIEVITNPDSVAPPTTAYRVKIVEASGRKIFIGSARAVGASAISESQGGHEYLGYYPPIESALTVSIIADDGDTEAAANVGNSKIFSVVLKFSIKE